MARFTDATAIPTLPLREQLLIAASLLALVVLAAWPGARSTEGALGWLPLWLVAAPLSAWAAVRWARLRDDAADATARARRPQATVHALRRSLPRVDNAPDVRRAA